MKAIVTIDGYPTKTFAADNFALDVADNVEDASVLQLVAYREVEEGEEEKVVFQVTASRLVAIEYVE